MKGTQSWVSPLYSNEEQTGATWRGRKWPIILFIFPRHKSQQKIKQNLQNYSIYLPRHKSQQKIRSLTQTITSSIFVHCFPEKALDVKKKKVKKNNREKVNQEGANKGNMIPLWFLPGHFGNEIAKLPVVFKTLETFFLATINSPLARPELNYASYLKKKTKVTKQIQSNFDIDDILISLEV